MSNPDHNTLLSLGQLALDYYRATQAAKKTEARLNKAEDTFRSIPELSHINFNFRLLYNYREEFAQFKQLHEEVKAARLNERRCKTKLFKAAKEVA
ncbi:hypothetical protein N5D67_14915 [Comamonas aquatica]|uniref:hypothetical protein n=1 Tax=Comamonas aquatica TaxID=225991 RepID=UPI0024472718|nr:hypothetical protein [Comamonas aquatica]MDH1903594.1 hypothetical protein [Comamonas aquatica]